MKTTNLLSALALGLGVLSSGAARAMQLLRFSSVRVRLSFSSDDLKIMSQIGNAHHRRQQRGRQF